MIGIKVKPLLVAVSGKGVGKMLHRVVVIGSRYGLTVAKMERALLHFARLLGQFDASASFPIVAAAFARHPDVIAKLHRQGIEFAIHGLYHVDHSQLPLAQQATSFTRARGLFEQSGLSASGFRCPYLRGNADTFDALRQAGFLYDSTHSLAWDVLNGRESEAYRHVLGFYGALSAREYPSLPRIEPNGLVEIPYNLPDDEALIDRLRFDDEWSMSQPWLAMLEETHRLGELFTLGLHPERIFRCEALLKTTLQEARKLMPGVWFARLDEIVHWWLARTQVRVEIHSPAAGEYSFILPQLKGLTLLGRSVEFVSPHHAWDRANWQMSGPEIYFRAEKRPFIGVSPESDPAMVSFLRQQGYIVEIAEDAKLHAYHFHFPQFMREAERQVLAQIEQTNQPLVRFGRWPGNAKSALCVTGDIDALTIWDYALRFIGS